VFSFAGEEGRQEEVIAVYARRETARRAVDLAMAGLAVLAERRPTIRPVLFGSRQRSKLPFAAEDLGVVPPRRLAQLYRSARAGIVFSLTTHSLVAHEMMASGLPTVELEGDNVGSALGASGDLVELAARRPDAIADAVERLLDDREAASAMARRARAFVEERTWQRAGDQLESALAHYLSTPRVPAGITGT
jgi:glycosyltransferase involved in cell wall biosynthesis